MLVFFKARLALLAVPKTGSTAYQAALRNKADIVVAGPPDLKHMTLRRFDRFFQNMFHRMFDADMEVMAVVREPVDWLGSWYRYRGRSDLDGRPNSTRDRSFDDFVAAYLKNPRPPFADVGSQSDFLIPRKNRPDATYVFKYENQTEIQEFLQDRLNMQFHLPHMNVSPTRPLDLRPETRSALEAACAEEFTLHASAR